MARSEKLKKFDELARKALERRKLRYEELRTWRSDQISSPSLLRLRSRPRNSPAPNESIMVAAYDLAGQSGSHRLVSIICSDPYQRHGSQTMHQQG